MPFFNLLIAFVSIAFIALAMVMLIHKMLWPLLERPVYALQRFGVARRSKLLATIGIILVGVAIDVFPTWLKDVIDKLTSS